MAKRFQPFKEFGRSTKKPKLDVSINKGRPLGPSQSWPNHIRSNVAEVVHVQSPVRNNVSNNNLWDDDDDDVILLATQVAESQVAIRTSEANFTDSDITFSEFAPHIHATTSTQRLTTVNVATVKATVSAPPTIENNNLSELFTDDDDFAEILDAAGKDKKVQEKTAALSIGKDNVFKKPMAIVSGTNVTNNRTSAALNTAQTLDGHQAAARRQVATERQVKMLMERLDTLKAENAKLTKDLSDSKAKIESKDGESSLLRDELRHMKQQLQTLKMEKIMSTEAAKTECKTKIAELTKRVEAKESELKLRKVEYSVLKMRHADETQRLEMSIRNANVAGEAPMEEDEEQATIKQNTRILHRLRGFSLPTGLGDVHNARLTELSANAYERTHQHVTGKRQHTPFQLELANAQTLLAQLQLQRQKWSWTLTEAADFNERALASAGNALPEFWTYVHGLEFPKYCNVHPYHEYYLRNDDYTSHNRNLHAEQQLYDDERAISLRRYISALSVMCGRAPNFAQQLLNEHHGDYALLQVACHAISKLGYSREICAHFGVLEAFAVLLRVLLRQLRTGDVAHMELLVGDLLKQLIFVRPSAWIFRELSYCVLELTRLPAALERICVNSDESTFYSDRMRSLYRFSNDSCILQVYAGLLEIAFPLNDILSESHMQLLTIICENHVRFAHFCFMKPPDFIHKLLPSYDDDDEDDDEEGDEPALQDPEGKAQSCKNTTCKTSSSEIYVNNSELGATANSTANMESRSAPSKKPTNSSNAARCECYTKLCLSVVTLLFQLLRQWQCTGRKVETPRVTEISQISVQLLHTIFCDNYSTHLFRYAEETTKHYLWLICEWWSENAERLKFNSVQNNFLKKLRAFHIMPKRLSEEGNPANVLNDLNEWHSLTNDSRIRNADSSVSLALAVENLNIMRSASDDAKFFEGLKGYAFNFE